MSDITISYKGNSIATMDASGTKTLLTEGKYCEDDITVDYVKPSGGGGVLTGSFTPTARANSATFDVGTTSTITNLIIVPKSEIPLKSNGKTFIAGIYTPNNFYHVIACTSNNAGSSWLSPSHIESGTGFSQSGSEITAVASRTASPAIAGGQFETIEYQWYAW